MRAQGSLRSRNCKHGGRKQFRPGSTKCSMLGNGRGTTDTSGGHMGEEGVNTDDLKAKPGWQTTEFYITVFTALMPAMTAVFNRDFSSQVQNWAAVAAGIATAGYALSRSMSKQAVVKARPTSSRRLCMRQPRQRRLRKPAHLPSERWQLCPLTRWRRSWPSSIDSPQLRWLWTTSNAT